MCAKVKLVRKPLEPPFGYYGSKRSIAEYVWGQLGNVSLYVEPFCGSAAVLLGRPHSPKWESINDVYCMVTNFWRSVKLYPSEVIASTSNPTNEIELLAWNNHLAKGRHDLEAMLTNDINYCDPATAGRWLWGVSASMAGGVGEFGIKRVRNITPRLCDGRGSQSLGRRDNLGEIMYTLADRLKHTRVYHGDWKEAVKPVNLRVGRPPGIYFDPPYLNITHSVDYITDSDVFHDVVRWCLENGHLNKIVLSGYPDLETDKLIGEGWTEFSWKRPHGMEGASKSLNLDMERVWSSPLCELTRKP